LLGESFLVGGDARLQRICKFVSPLLLSSLGISSLVLDRWEISQRRVQPSMVVEFDPTPEDIT